MRVWMRAWMGWAGLGLVGAGLCGLGIGGWVRMGKRKRSIGELAFVSLWFCGFCKREEGQ